MQCLCLELTMKLSKGLRQRWIQLLRKHRQNLLSLLVIIFTQVALPNIAMETVPRTTSQRFLINSKVPSKTFTTVPTWKAKSGWESLAIMITEVFASTWVGLSKSTTRGTSCQSVGCCQLSTITGIYGSQKVEQMIGMRKISQSTCSFSIATMLIQAQGMSTTTCVPERATPITGFTPKAFVILLAIHVSAISAMSVEGVMGKI